MDKQQWAYEQGYRTALRSLGIKDDIDSGDGNNARMAKAILGGINNSVEDLADIIDKGSVLADRIQDEFQKLRKILSSGAGQEDNPQNAGLKEWYDKLDSASSILSILQGNASSGNKFKGNFDNLKQAVDDWKANITDVPLE